MQDTLVNIGIYLTYALIVIGTIAAVVFPIIHTATNPKQAKQALVSIGAILVLVVISYVLAGDEVLKSYERYGITASSSKMVSTGLVLFYIMAIISVIALIYSEISKAFK